MEFLAQYGMFALKTLTLVFAFLILFVGVLGLGFRPKCRVTIKSLNKHYDEAKEMMQKEVCGIKKEKKTKKEKKKKRDERQSTVFVLDFCGDLKATQVEQLREEITLVLSVATPNDEIVIRLESPGGTVNGYGLAASQLQRIRDNNIPLTVCIDKVAASGGYLMACVANTVIAAPFAMIGSIGVVAQLPNFHRWLKKQEIDIELLTAGEYKRTLTMFAENTKEGRQKFQEDLNAIHSQFKDHVMTNRKQIDLNEISTGEHWLAKDALELKLVDRLETSDSYLINKMPSHNIYQITIKGKQNLADKLLKPAMKLLHPWA
jgi:serine protease SohB